MSEITHHGARQVVSPETLRAVLRRAGESCYCAQEDGIEWDVAGGGCPQHPTMPDDTHREVCHYGGGT